jgi:LppP/LprE lipoprotein
MTAEQAGAFVAGMAGPYGHWVPDVAAYRSPAELSAVIGSTPRGTGSSPMQIFFFHRGTYVGTATPEPRMALRVTTQTADSVTVNYLHYKPSDPTCCPSLPDYVVRFRWDGHLVTLDPAPPLGQGAAE